MGTFYQRSAMMIQPNLRSFANKTDDDPKNPDLDKFEQQKKLKKIGSKSVKKDEKAVEADSATETPAKKKRRTKAEVEADKIER